jgi:hypothetical protein
MAFRFFGPRVPPIGSNGGSPPRSYAGPTARERELEAEVRALRAGQAQLVRAEEEARTNLGAIQDSLDVLAGEIDKRARAVRDPALAEHGAKVIGRVRRYIAQRGARNLSPSTLATMIRCFIGLERPERGSWIESFMEESAAKASPRSPQAVQASAQQIVDAGARARNERSAPDVRTGVVRKLRSDLPPVGSTARDMINIDRKRRGLAPYGDDE